MVVSGGLPGTLGARWSGWATSSQRRLSAGRKLAIYSEAHLPLVEAKITKMLGGGQIAADICRFAHRSPNVLKAVADAIAVAYRSGCTRSLLDASPEVARAFADIVTESGITRKAARLNAASWVAGPHFVSPYMSSRGRLALDIIGPNRLDAEMDGEDVERVLWQQGNAFVLLDAAGWTYFDAKGNETGFEGHAVGVAPVVPFVAFDGGEDWWATAAHDGLADTTITCSYKLALGLYVQQVNPKKQLVITGQLEKTPKGQVLGHPVQPVLLPEGTAQALDVIGNINANTTWKKADSPIRMTGDVTVAGHVTLTIEPGTVIEAAATDGLGSGTDTARVEFIIKGSLKAVGTSASRITIRGASHASNGWYGISLEPGAKDSALSFADGWDPFYLTVDELGALLARARDWPEWRARDENGEKLSLVFSPDEVFDVAVDLRRSSPTFGRCEGFVLSAQNKRMLWVPPGFAHGNFFPEETTIEYLCTGQWNPACEAGISPLSADIDWSLCDPELYAMFVAHIKPDNKPLLTDKDRDGFSVAGWLADPRSQVFEYGAG